MRLKGGKVLLDMSFVTFINEPNIQLSDEEMNAILEKGAVAKFKTETGHYCIRNVEFDAFELTEPYFKMYHIFNYDGEYYDLLLNTTTKLIYIEIE